MDACQDAGRLWHPDDADSEYFGAPLPDDYRAHAGIPRNLSHFLDRGSLIALDAALQAVEHAGLGAGAGDARRFSVSDGLSYRAPGQATLFVPYGHLVARALGVRGAVIESAGAEASGMAALVAGAAMVRHKEADVVVAGAAQALQKPLVDHLRAQGFAGDTPARPFDVTHGTAVMGEGAAYVVVEDKEHAIARGAPILAEVAGAGHLFDSVAEPLAISDAAEAGRVMQAALASAGFMQNQVDLIVSCADGREAVDFAEGYGIKRTFGRHAYYAGVTTAGATAGLTMAASGPISVALALEAMRRQESPPIAGFENEEQDLDLAYVRETKAEKLDCILVTSLGLGGTNASILLTR
jgi:3-oxoacyl-(acyl-carrier-protein) synthase